jgi:hypothetical protein
VFSSESSRRRRAKWTEWGMSGWVIVPVWGLWRMRWCCWACVDAERIMMEMRNRDDILA